MIGASGYLQNHEIERGMKQPEQSSPVEYAYMEIQCAQCA
jgi:hypothetical protein